MDNTSMTKILQRTPTVVEKKETHTKEKEAIIGDQISNST